MDRHYSLIVSSLNRASGTSDNWSTQLARPITTSPDAVCMLTQCVFGNTWSTFDDANDTLVIVGNNGVVNNIPTWWKVYTIQIPHRAYDIDTICSTLQTLIQEAMYDDYLDQWIIGIAWTVTATNDGHILFQMGTPFGVASPFPLCFKILNKDEVSGKLLDYYNGPIAPIGANYIRPYANRLANRVLGIADTPNLGNPSYSADFLFNSLRTYNVFIHSSMNQFASQGPGSGDSDVIAAIPVMAPLGSLNVGQSSGSDIDVFPVPNMNLSTLSFYLTDDHGQQLTLKDGYVTLVFKIYDSP